MYLFKKNLLCIISSCYICINLRIKSVLNFRLALIIGDLRSLTEETGWIFKEERSNQIYFFSDCLKNCLIQEYNLYPKGFVFFSTSLPFHWKKEGLSTEMSTGIIWDFTLFLKTLKSEVLIPKYQLISLYNRLGNKFQNY